MSNIPPLPFRTEDLIYHLDKLDIEYKIHEHEPVFTVAQAEHIKKAMPGTHCRNLFLKDKKGNMFLVTLANETKVDLKKMACKLGSGRLSFASPQKLWDQLGIRPGSVNPFCIVNDKNREVHMILDQYMMQQDLINVHPMDNAMTIALRPSALLLFIDSIGHNANITDLSSCAPET